MSGLRIAHFSLQWTRDCCRSLIETSFALEQSFIAFAWIPSVKHVTLIHRCHPSTDSPPVLHTSHYTEQASRNSAFQHFPGAGRAFGR